MENCYSNTHAYGLTLTQTLWSFESFSRLKEANFIAASAQADLLGAQQSLLLRVAVLVHEAPARWSPRDPTRRR